MTDLLGSVGLEIYIFSNVLGGSVIVTSVVWFGRWQDEELELKLMLLLFYLAESNTINRCLDLELVTGKIQVFPVFPL